VKTRFNRVWLILLLILASYGRSQAQPTILQQPVSILDQILGIDVSLCVTAQSDSSTNLQYQWLRNGVIIPDATNSCLTIEGLQAIDCGAFSVLVSDGVGVVVSESAKVSVLGSILQAVDQLIDALDLGTNGYILSYNTNAVKQSGTPDIIPGDPGGSEVWFKWSVPLVQSSGIVTFSTLGSDFDTTMAAYTGSEPNGLTPVPSAISDDDAAGYLNSQVTFYAVKGTTYLIAVDGFYGVQGDLVLSWHLYPGSSTLPNAVPMPQSIVASNGATVTLNSPWPGNNCAWLLNGSVVASNTNVLIITNLSADTVGSYVARFTTSDNISVSAEPTRVQMNTLEDGSTDTNSIAWVKFLNSANTAFAQPMAGKQVVRKLGGGGSDSSGYSCSQTFSTTGNPDEPGQPVICNQNGAHAGWYSYVTPASGALLINTAGSKFNTILGVFTGPGNSFTNLTNIGCGYTTNYTLEGQPSVYIPNVPAGQTNYIVVEGENGASGTVQLNIGFGIPLSIISPPQPQAVGPGTNVNLSVGVSGSGPISYTWQFNGTNLFGATSSTLTIPSMQAFFAGSYTVIVSNSISIVTTQAVLAYIDPVAISTAPQSQSAGPGTNVTFGVTASGTGPISYSWQFDGTNVAGATDSALAITNMQPFEAGTYSVIVSNSASVVTNRAILTYLAPVDILSETQSQTDGPGTNVVLDVSASGSGPITYIWQFDGTNLVWATGSTLDITNMQAFEAGTYIVTVSNSISAATTQVVLGYLSPVAILSAPESQSAGPGTNVTLGVTANGSGPISYSWQFDGTNLAGATDSTLTITNMQAFDAGTYMVTVSNSISTATTQAVLTYLPPVGISSAPQNLSAGPGTNVTFGVTATGSGPITYSWQFEGSNLAGATNSMLTITNMQAFDAGTYTVTVSNAISATTAQVVLTYIAPVAILTAPQSQSAGPGTNVTLGVTANGSGPITYSWQFDGTNLAGATDSTLTITNMQSFDAGSYTVTVSNAISAATAQAVISYAVSPAILAQPVSQTVPPNATAVLNVSATGSPAPVFTWYANGAPLACNASQLSIPSFQSTNQGFYTVVISNAFGAVTSSPALLLLNTPATISSYGVVNGAFSLQISGAIGTNYVIEGSSDLLHWIPLFTNNALTGSLNFTDTNTDLVCRFYRGVTNSP
jgi:hypothetical protein